MPDVDFSAPTQEPHHDPQSPLERNLRPRRYRVRLPRGPVPSGRLTVGKIRHRDDRDLAAALTQSQGPVLVDFHATWCAPCRALAPSLEALADEAGGHLAVIQVDIDQAPAAAHAFGVRSVPTLVLLDDGRIRGVRVGLQSMSELRSWIASVASPLSVART